MVGERSNGSSLYQNMLQQILSDVLRIILKQIFKNFFFDSVIVAILICFSFNALQKQFHEGLTRDG